LYLKSIEGVGKSTLTEFFAKFVIGPDLTLVSGSGPLKVRFNEPLANKLLVIFEELETFSFNDWQLVSAKLKRYATGALIQIHPKGKPEYTLDNINNYIINSNMSLKDSHGRRIAIPDISTKRKDDVAYWDLIYASCFNMDVGEAMNAMLLEIDLTDFNSQSFPQTKAKSDSVASRIGILFEFLKECYVFTNSPTSPSSTQLAICISSLYPMQRITQPSVRLCPR